MTDIQRAAPRRTRRRHPQLEALLASKAGRVGLVIVTIVAACAIFGQWLAPHDPFEIDTVNRLQSPSASHPFGTDELGRDLFSRIVYGARYAALIATVSVGISAFVGVMLGLLATAFGRLADSLIMRVMDVMLGFPYILLLLAMVSILGPNLRNAVISVGVGGIPGYARLVRSEALAIRELQHYQAAVALGAGRWRLMTKSVLPNVAGSVIVYSTLTMPLAILAAAALSFLGLGAQPPAPEWGAMLVDARTFLYTAPWLVLAPGLAIFTTILGLNLLGDALRDALDPKHA